MLVPARNISIGLIVVAVLAVVAYVALRPASPPASAPPEAATSSGTSPTPSPTADTGPIRSVLVVPFRMKTLGEPEGASPGIIGAGMADALQTRLQRVLQIRVARAVGASAAESPQQTGARLGVDAVISGLIEHSGPTFRAALTLVRVSSGERLSTMVSQTGAASLLELADEAAAHLATALRPDLPATDRALLTEKDTTNPEAYALFIQARERARGRSPADVDAAIQLYEAALQRDARFVRAHAELATAYGQLDPATDPLVRRPRAKAAAERAVTLSGTSAQAHAALGYVRYRFEWRWLDAETEFAKAVAANPFDAFVRHHNGLFLHAIGRTADALAELEQALALEPDSPVIRADMVAPLLRAGRTADARAALDTLTATAPDWPPLAQLTADVLAAEGRDAESVEMLWQALLAQGGSADRVNELRAAYKAGGKAAMTERRIAQLTTELEDGPTPPASYRLATELALAHAGLKQRDQTLHWLAVAIDLHEDIPLYMRSSAAFDFVREDPEFTELERRAGFPSGASITNRAP